ncbi:MAG: hypothetical protein ACYCVD_03115 [Desulfitobacteriaceae bacterium]
MDEQKIIELLEHILDKVGNLDKRVLSVEVKVEHDVSDKISALFDAREVQKEVNERVFNQLDRIEAKIDVLQLETSHVRRAK